MPTRAVILQHGEKDRTPGDPGLTARGRRQADDAAHAISALAPVALLSSPLRRAIQTATPLSELCALPLRIDPRLRERMNLEHGEDVERFTRNWARTSTDRAWAPPQGRSSARTAQDMLEALDDAAVQDGTIVAAGHGGATVDLLRDLLGDIALEECAPGLIEHGVPGGAITTLERAGGRWVPVAIASTAHIAASDRSGHAPA
ncbi:histidine phosphatase family protein [Brachybacterium hainanense]|uniref:Histidine phosphatase family protein n=1 Tax=Brachybacterium hainanense TaxID=1541174 RepID=A0ABV6RA59_9MICO